MEEVPSIQTMSFTLPVQVIKGQVWQYTWYIPLNIGYFQP